MPTAPASTGSGHCGEELRLPIAILIDTKGPEIRLGTFPEKVTLKAGDTFTLTTVPAEGTAERASISFAGLPETWIKAATSSSTTA